MDRGLPNYIDSFTRHGKDQAIYDFLLTGDYDNLPFFLATLNLFEGLYYLSNSYQPPRHTIPKVIHQIWLGKNEIPSCCKRWMSVWQHLEGVEYKLWTDDDIKDLPITNKKFYESCTGLGAKTDILRYEILHRFGGLYVDVDIECLFPEFFIRSLETLDFFAGTEPLCQGLGVWVASSLIASMPGHPILKQLVENFPEAYPTTGKTSSVIVTGPVYITIHLKEAFRKMTAENERVVIFPTGYFNPISVEESAALELDSEEKRTYFPETVSVHYFKRLWGWGLPR